MYYRKKIIVPFWIHMWLTLPFFSYVLGLIIKNHESQGYIASKSKESFIIIIWADFHLSLDKSKWLEAIRQILMDAAFSSKYCFFHKDKNCLSTTTFHIAVKKMCLHILTPLLVQQYSLFWILYFKFMKDKSLLNIRLGDLHSFRIGFSQGFKFDRNRDLKRTCQRESSFENFKRFNTNKLVQAAAQIFFWDFEDWVIFNSISFCLLILMGMNPKSRSSW